MMTGAGIVPFTLLCNMLSNKNYFKKKKAVEDDEKNYGEEYMEFKSAVYKEKPDRIIIKKQGTTNEFYIFDKSNKEY